MSPNEIRTKIITDVNGFVSGTGRAYNSVKQLISSFDNLNSTMQKNQELIRKTETSVAGLNTTLVNMSAAFQSYERFQNVFSSVLSGAYNYNKVLETNAVGIGGILTSMVKVNGKQLEWNESMAMSTEIMNKLRKEALRTSATAPELIDTFRGLLGPGLGAGMSVDEIMRLTTVGVTAVKSIGLNGTQLIQELRGLVQGGIKPASSTLATALGLKDKDIKAARASSEGLFKFLMKRLEGFDKSVKANAKTVQGRLDIMKEGFYQGIGEGTKGLWKDFSDEIKALSENFLVLNKEKDQMELNPRFVEQVKSVAKTVTTIKDVFSGVFGGLTSDASTLLKALFLGVGTKLGIGALNSIVNVTKKGADRFAELANSVTETGIRLKQLEKVENGLGNFTETIKLQSEQQQRLNEFVSEATKGVYNLNKRYMELGATREQATKWQNKIVSSINKGASAEEIKNMITNYEKLAIEYKTVNEEKLKSAEAERLVNEKNLAIDKERLEIKKLTEKYQKEATKGLLGAINEGKKNANASRSEIASYASGKNNQNSLYAFEQKLRASTFDRALQEEILLDIKKKIWQGDFESANNSIARFEKSIELYKTLAEEEKLDLEYNKEKAKVQREQYQWLTKQIEANVKLEQAKPKLSEEQQRFNLLRNSVKETIALANAQQKADKLSKDGAYVQKWLSGKTKSKAFTDENKAMVTDLVAKMKEAGFSQAKADEIAKSFINQLQSSKVSAERIKQVYETTTQELVKIKERYALIKEQGTNVFNSALSAGLNKEQAEKLRQSYVETMTKAGTDSANAWKKTFDEQIKHVEEKINGVMRGVGAKTNNGVKMPTFTNAEQLANAQKELEFNFQRTMQNYVKISSESANKIISTFETIAKAEKDGLLVSAEADKLRLDYKKLVADGYMEEALAVQKVIEAQYKEGQLAGEKAQKDREQAQVSGKQVATNKELALTLERIAELNGNVLTSNQRNAMSAILSGEMQRKGYTRAEEALQSLLKMERDIGEEIKKTGGIAPPVYEKITQAIKMVLSAERELTEAELENVKAIIKQGEGYSKLGLMMERAKGIASNFGSVLTSLGFIYQMVRGESESFAGRLAESAITIGFVTSSVITLCGNLKELYITLKSIKMLSTVMSLTKNPWIMGATLLGTGVYAANEYINYKNNKAAGLSDAERAKRERINNAFNETNINTKKLFGDMELANPPALGDESDKKKNAIAKLKEQARSAKDGYQVLVDTITNANNKLNGGVDKYTEKAGEAKKKVDAWKKSLNDLLAKGGQYSELGDNEKNAVNKLISDYEKLNKAEIERQRNADNYERALQRIKNVEDNLDISAYDASILRSNILKAEITDMQDRLKNEQLNADERLKIETNLVAKKRELREAEQRQLMIDYDDILAHIKNTTYNQTETIKGAYNTIRDNFANFGQNMMTEGVNLGKRFTDLFSNIANTVINTLMKIAMQGLIVNSILGAFGMGGSPKTLTTSGGTTKTSFGIGAISDLSGVSLKGRTFAKGGVADGWSIVGEKGPELVNFSSPARVYTAEQTRNALGGGNGNLNIKFDIKNNTNQQIEATQTGQSFDGESYVIGIVLNAVATNQNGIRSALKGALST